MPNDLQTALDCLTSKEAHTVYWDYYNGNQPIMYSAERLRELFQKIDVKFRENWCGVVVDAVMDRLNITGFQIANNEALQRRLDEIWKQTEMYLDSDDTHLAALVTGEAYVIVWPNEDGEIESYYNDPRNVMVRYDESSPRLMRFAAKWWLDEDKRRRVTLYYPDRLEHYVSSNTEDDSTLVSKAEEFLLDGEPEPNPYGEIPVFHFKRERRGVISELSNIIEPQNAINKLMNDMMICAEYGAFPQRWIISMGNINGLKNNPSEIWNLPGSFTNQGEQATEVGQFAPANLDNYLDAIDKLASFIAVTTRTPKHYFISLTRDASGESLIAMEAPLNKKTARYIERFSATWRRFAAFVLKLDRNVEVPLTEIEPVFEDPETVQPVMVADILQKERAAGIPLVTACRRAGFSEAEMRQLEADLAEEARREATVADAAMAAAMREFDRGGGTQRVRPSNAGRPSSSERGGN